MHAVKQPASRPLECRTGSECFIPAQHRRRLHHAFCRANGNRNGSSGSSSSSNSSSESSSIKTKPTPTKQSIIDTQSPTTTTATATATNEWAGPAEPAYMANLLVRCPDSKGVVASLAQLLYGMNCTFVHFFVFRSPHPSLFSHCPLTSPTHKSTQNKSNRQYHYIRPILRP